MRSSTNDPTDAGADEQAGRAPVGRVTLVLTAEAAGAPMRRNARVEVIAGVGIAGDRYATGRGHWSAPRWLDQEITLVEAEVARELGLAPEQLRRNLVTEGVRLMDLVGQRFRVGDHGVVLEGVRPCDPCAYIEAFTRPGAARDLASRGGLRARAIVGGTLRPGDALILLPHAGDTPSTDKR